MRLKGFELLLIDSDEDSLEVLAGYLESEGASVRSALNAGQALRLARERPARVVISELELPDRDGGELVRELSDIHGEPMLPSLALTAHAGLAAEAQSQRASFHKYLIKPVLLSDVTTALVSLSSECPETPTLARSFSPDDVRQFLQAKNYRALLALLNATAEYRFSSLFRFDAERLRSVWSFDREQPAFDTFPLDAMLSDSYCTHVRDLGTPLVVEDSSSDARVEDQARRLATRSFCGVPLLRRDGAMYGALCHFDSEPRPADASALESLSSVARLFRDLGG